MLQALQAKQARMQYSLYLPCCDGEKSLRNGEDTPIP